MELNPRAGNLTCEEVRELLSDLLDVRCGEIPHPDGTRLAEPGLRAAVELHLAGCAACRAELDALWEVGAAYAEFDVGEPPAQYFADYAQKVRARMSLGASVQRVIRPPVQVFSPRRRIWSLAATAALAAAVILAILLGNVVTPIKPKSDHTNTIALAPTKKSVPSASKTPGQTPLMVWTPSRDGVQTAAQEFFVNPAAPEQTLTPLQKDEGQYGYLVVGERIAAGRPPLLGAELRTTRDVDRIKNEGPGGLMVYNVYRDSPAYKMGLRKNDYIVGVNDMPVESGGVEDAVKFLTALHELGAGTPVSIHVVRPDHSEFIYMRPFEGVLGE